MPIEVGVVKDETRLKAIIPTLNAILNKNPKAVIIASHLGRPKGVPDLSLSLKPVCCALQNLLNEKINFLPDCIGPIVKKEVLFEYDGPKY